jgi:DNA-binding transcriptional LysR family regulator
MPLPLDAVVVLDAIDRRGSFAAAAAELHRVPSAVTYQVRRLEEELDVLVFDRRGHRARLTAAGRELLAEGRRLLRSADELERRVRQIASGWEAELRIAIDAAVPLPLLCPLVSEFDRRCRHEGPARTRLRFAAEALAGTWEALVDGRAELAIGAAGDPVHGAGVRSRRLAVVEEVFAVAPAHPLAALSEPLGTAEIAAHRAIVVADSARRLQPRTIGVLDGQDALAVPDMATKLAFIAGGLGCGYLPRYVAAPEAARGRLLIRDVAEPKPAQPVHVAWTRERPGRALAWWIHALEQGRWTAALAA